MIVSDFATFLNSISSYSQTLLIIVGIGVGFLGLIFIALCMINSTLKQQRSNEVVAHAQPVVAPTATVVNTPNKQELIAAISVAIAEASGKDIEAIRIKSIKRI